MNIRRVGGACPRSPPAGGRKGRPYEDKRQCDASVSLSRKLRWEGSPQGAPLRRQAPVRRISVPCPESFDRKVRRRGGACPRPRAAARAAPTKTSASATRQCPCPESFDRKVRRRGGACPRPRAAARAAPTKTGASAAHQCPCPESFDRKVRRRGGACPARGPPPQNCAGTYRPSNARSAVMTRADQEFSRATARRCARKSGVAALLARLVERAREFLGGRRDADLGMRPAFLHRRRDDGPCTGEVFVELQGRGRLRDRVDAEGNRRDVEQREISGQADVVARTDPADVLSLEQRLPREALVVLRADQDEAPVGPGCRDLRRGADSRTTPRGRRSNRPPAPPARETRADPGREAARRERRTARTRRRSEGRSRPDASRGPRRGAAGRPSRRASPPRRALSWLRSSKARSCGKTERSSIQS